MAGRHDPAHEEPACVEGRAGSLMGLGLLDVPPPHSPEMPVAWGQGDHLLKEKVGGPLHRRITK